MEVPPLRIFNHSDPIQHYSYPSRSFPELQANANNRGKELFDYLYKETPPAANPTTLLPPSFRIITDPAVGEIAVPVGDVDSSQNKATKEYSSLRAEVIKGFSDNAVQIYQRGYGITNANSRRPIIATTSLAPCIAVLAYRSDTKTAALTHVDADQDFASLEDMLNLEDFREVANVQLHFYGGMAGIDECRNTCYGLLNAVITINQRRPNFIIYAFDVMAVPHKTDFSFDTRTGKKFAAYGGFDGLRGFLLDSQFRLWPNGNYLANQDSVQMKNAAEALPGGDPTKAALKRIRLQWDGTTRLQTFAANVNRTICGLVVQKASLPHVVDPTFTAGAISALMVKNVPIAFEQSLKDWVVNINNQAANPQSPASLASAPKAATSIVAAIQPVLQANVTAAQRAQNLETAINNWVAANPHPYERKY